MERDKHMQDEVKKVVESNEDLERQKIVEEVFGMSEKKEKVVKEKKVDATGKLTTAQKDTYAKEIIEYVKGKYSVDGDTLRKLLAFTYNLSHKMKGG